MHEIVEVFKKKAGFYTRLFIYIFFFDLMLLAIISTGIGRVSYILYSDSFSIDNLKRSEILKKNRIDIDENNKVISLIGDDINRVYRQKHIRQLSGSVEVKEYKVKRGDNIWLICRRFRISEAELFKANNLKTEMLYTGQVLFIPVYKGRLKLPDVDLAFLWPVTGMISSSFGWRTHPITMKKDFHDGIDIVADKYTPVLASEDGIVIFTGYRKYAGRTVIMEHIDGFSTFYAHLNSISVKKGDIIGKGQIVGRVGKTGYSTGYHLHFGMKLYGTSIDPIKYLNEYIEP